MGQNREKPCNNGNVNGSEFLSSKSAHNIGRGIAGWNLEIQGPSR